MKRLHDPTIVSQLNLESRATYRHLEVLFRCFESDILSHLNSLQGRGVPRPQVIGVRREVAARLRAFAETIISNSATIAFALLFVSVAWTSAVATTVWEGNIPGSGAECFTPRLDEGEWYTLTVAGVVGTGLRADALHFSDAVGNFSKRTVNFYIEGTPASRFLVTEDRAGHRYTFAFRGSGSRAAFRLDFGHHFWSGRRRELKGGLTAVLTRAAGPPGGLWWRLPRAVRRHPGRSVVVAAGAGFVLFVLAGWIAETVADFRRWSWEAPSAERSPSTASSSAPVPPPDPEARSRQREARLCRLADRLERQHPDAANWADDAYVERYARKHTKELLERRHEIVGAHASVAEEDGLLDYIEERRPTLYAALSGKLRALIIAQRLDVDDPGGSRAIAKSGAADRPETRDKRIRREAKEQEAALVAALRAQQRLHGVLEKEDVPPGTRDALVGLIDAWVADVTGVQEEHDETESKGEARPEIKVLR